MSSSTTNGSGTMRYFSRRMCFAFLEYGQYDLEKMITVKRVSLWQGMRAWWWPTWALLEDSVHGHLDLVVFQCLILLHRRLVA